jgi:hypothetical protein
MFVVPKLASGELPIYFFYSFVMKQIMLTQIVVLSLFGGGSVEDTMTKSGSECYAVTGAISGTSQLPNGQKRSRYCAEQSIFELKN